LAKALPSAALSKTLSANPQSAKPSLSSVVYRALGKGFAECPTLGKLRIEKKLEKNREFF
jgi:hypothetical protein